MGGAEKLAEQEKKPTDDSGEPPMLPPQLQTAHGHGPTPAIQVPPLAVKPKRIKRRASGPATAHAFRASCHAQLATRPFAAMGRSTRLLVAHRPHAFEQHVMRVGEVPIFSLSAELLLALELDPLRARPWPDHHPDAARRERVAAAVVPTRLLRPPIPGEARTLLLDPISNAAVVPVLPVPCLSRAEAMAEKLRAAMSRRV